MSRVKIFYWIFTCNQCGFRTEPMLKETLPEGWKLTWARDQNGKWTPSDVCDSCMKVEKNV